jgi:hypothetical protein
LQKSEGEEGLGEEGEMGVVGDVVGDDGLEMCAGIEEVEGYKEAETSRRHISIEACDLGCLAEDIFEVLVREMVVLIAVMEVVLRRGFDRPLIYGYDDVTAAACSDV